MKNIVRYALVLLVLGCGGVANAQNVTLTLGNMQEVGSYNPMRWKYGAVTCTTPNASTRITSIIISMINNDILSSAAAPSGSDMKTNTSSGDNPRTVLYTFGNPITVAVAAEFIKGITFQRTTAGGVNANPYVNITMDANPTFLPPGTPTAPTTITVWDKHPDGSTHYYVWVSEPSIIWMKAYHDAKRYYFQGMRGYLATMTSALESQLLTNISDIAGWSGGIRTTSDIADKEKFNSNNAAPGISNTTGNIGTIYRWVCGPETNFQYYKGPTRTSSGAGAMNNAFTDWATGEPNNSGGEYYMQVNFTAFKWNDLPHSSGTPKGYFIEFGGNGQPYTVGAASYGVNAKYHTPTAPTTNDQWYGFSPGNKVSTSTTFKPNVMRSNILIIE